MLEDEDKEFRISSQWNSRFLHLIAMVSSQQGQVEGMAFDPVLVLWIHGRPKRKTLVINDITSDLFFKPETEGLLCFSILP